VDFSEKVLTRGKSGRTELRALESRGIYVITKYLDPKTLKLADKKRKITLKTSTGEIHEFFIIPLKDAKRSLLIEAEKEEKDRKVWNEEKGVEEDLWPEDC
jgi:hypothetical protein